MKAITYSQYGSAEVMRLEDVPLPDATGKNVLVKVHAAAINPVDWMIRNGVMKMLTGKKFPRSMGVDLAGVVESVGQDVTSLAPGDEVFGWCPYKLSGAFAEYVLVSDETLFKKPANSNFEQAACFPMAGATAYKALVLKAKISSGDKVLINGCTGGVGLFALQVAKAQGAIVTGTCSTKNVELAKQYGADDVVDYRQTNIEDHGSQFDIILEASAKLSYKQAKGILAKNGRFLDLNATPASLLKSIFSSKYFAIMTSVDNADLTILSQMATDGSLKAHIHEAFPLEGAIKGLTEMEQSRSVIGKAVITM